MAKVKGTLISGSSKADKQKNKVAERVRSQRRHKKSSLEKPLITVVTAVFNAEIHLEETIQSIIQQTYDNIEYIVIDGRSTDGTLDIIKKYEEHIDYWISESDEGMYDALSKGFSLAEGDLICYLNAGDLFFSKSMETAASYFKETKVKWFTGFRSVCNEESCVTGVDLPYQYSPKLIREGVYGRHLPFIQQESTIWHKDLMCLVNMDMFRKLKLAGDYYLWFCFSFKEELAIVKTLVGIFKKHDGQLSENLIGYWKEVDLFSKKVKLTTRLKICFEMSIWALHPKIRRFFKKNVWGYDHLKKSWRKGL